MPTQDYFSMTQFHDIGNIAYKIRCRRSQRKTPPEGKERAEMIDKDGYSYMVVCDNCGEGVEVSTWDKVLEFMRDEGWKKKKVGNTLESLLPLNVRREINA